MTKIPSVLNHSITKFFALYTSFLKTHFSSDLVKQWATYIGITSRINFKKYLSEKKPLPHKVIEDFISQLDLSDSEEKLFRSNEKIGVTDSTKDATYYVEDSFFASPINTILLNLCALQVPMSQEKIHLILQDKYSAEQINTALEYLCKKELINQNVNTYQRIFHGRITTPPGVKSHSSRAYFKESYELANAAWELPLNVRELGSFTFRIEQKDIGKMKDIARKFRQDLIALNTEDSDSVFQASFAVFPIYNQDVSTHF